MRRQVSILILSLTLSLLLFTSLAYGDCFFFGDWGEETQLPQQGVDKRHEIVV
jgi:hypothetical protein